VLGLPGASGQAGAGAAWGERSGRCWGCLGWPWRQATKKPA